jgi:hypothetical protein
MATPRAMQCEPLGLGRLQELSLSRIESEPHRLTFRRACLAGELTIAIHYNS